MYMYIVFFCIVLHVLISNLFLPTSLSLSLSPSLSLTHSGRRNPGQFRAQTGGGGITSYQPNPAAAGPTPPIHQLIPPSSMIQTTGGGAYVSVWNSMHMYSLLVAMKYELEQY